MSLPVPATSGRSKSWFYPLKSAALVYTVKGASVYSVVTPEIYQPPETWRLIILCQPSRRCGAPTARSIPLVKAARPSEIEIVAGVQSHPLNGPVVGRCADPALIVFKKRRDSLYLHGLSEFPTSSTMATCVT